MKHILPIILALALALGGCSYFSPQTAEEPEELPPEEVTQETESRIPVLPAEPVSNADDLFSINYDPNASLNPLYGTNMFNRDLFSLCYEGLFRLDEHFEPVPVLAESWATEDGVTWTITLREGIKLHDGTDLTPEDVVYSVNRAAGGNKYKARLSGIIAVNASGERDVVFVLASANYHFLSRLDLPIIKSGTSSDTVAPIGTGPYYMTDFGYLRAFREHRDYDSLPVSRVHLQEVPTAQLGMSFTGKTVDILDLDPLGSVELSIHADYELRYYDTSSLIYLAFNTRAQAGKDPAIRLAISRVIDREALNSSALERSAVPAPLVLSPVLGFYDAAWEEGTGYDREYFDRVIIDDGVMDMDDDGFWDISRLSDSLKYVIVVNAENEHRVALAEAISDTLGILGFRTELRALDYADYTQALAAGSFDIAVAEVKLTADFDLTPLLGASGSLNFGRASGYDELLREYLKTTGEEHTAAAKALCDFAKTDCAIIPIAYKRGTILTHMGSVRNMMPTQTGVFADVAEWEIKP